MIIGTLLDQVGLHPAAWRHDSTPPGGALDYGHFARLARIAEAGKLDFLFFADGLAVRRGDQRTMCRTNIHITHYEPVTLLAALAPVTSHIGLAATVSTSFSEPYSAARQFAAIDHISGGRAAWNVVTTSDPDAAANFGAEHGTHADRYARANEFVDVVKRLWDSWDDDAFLRDRQSGIYYDPAKMHELNHRGEYFRVRGPLNIDRPPQGRPVIVSAGGSPQGRDHAARTSEVVFALSSSIESSKAFYADQKSRLAQYGREPDEMKILVALTTYIGESQAQAEDLLASFHAQIHPDVGRAYISVDLGADLTGLPVDEPIPPHLLPAGTGKAQSYFDSMMEIIRTRNPTVRQLYQLAAASRGDLRPIVGTPAAIADMMEEWVAAGATDGFMLTPPDLPGGLESFVTKVVPELQRRGLFRRDYTGRTLRDHLGLRRPDLRRP